MAGSWSEIENKPSAGAHETPPVGSHAAVCVALVNLGRQDEEYQGTKKVQHKILLCWELCNEVQAGSTNRHLIAESYTFSLNEKAKLAALLKSWRGKPVAAGEKFDLKKILGAPCLVNVTHTEWGYAKLAGVSRLPKGMAASKPLRPITVCGVGEDAEIPDWLPYQYGRPVGEIVAESHECRPERAASGVTAAGSPNGKRHGDGPDNSDDTPF